MWARVLELLSAATLVSCFASCWSSGANLRELEITGYSGDQVWRGVSDFARTRGFSVDTKETDLGRGVFQTQWSGEAAAFRGGSRRRLRIEIKPLDVNIPKWRVRYYVEEQHVPDTSKNMNPAEEDWVFARQHQVTESQFLRVMQISFPPPPGARAPNPNAGADIRG